MSQATILGFIGLGVMGEPMCANLVQKSGCQVRAFDMSADAIERVVEKGAIAETTAAAVGEAAEIVFLSLPSIAEVEAVTAQLLAAPKRPRMIVDMSTSDVARTRELAAKLQEAGIAFVDAPVARTKQAAIDGTLLISVGGSETDAATVRPYLECMGSDVLHCGDIGSGQLVKILNNMMVFMTVNALSEVLTIGRRAGMDGEALFQLLSQGSADSFVLRNHGIKSLARDQFPEKTFPMVYAIKDASLALSLADAANFRPHIAQYTYDLMCRARDAGLGQNYHPAMVQLVDGRVNTIVPTPD